MLLLTFFGRGIIREYVNLLRWCHQMNRKKNKTKAERKTLLMVRNMKKKKKEG